MFHIMSTIIMGWVFPFVGIGLKSNIAQLWCQTPIPIQYVATKVKCMKCKCCEAVNKLSCAGASRGMSAMSVCRTPYSHAMSMIACTVGSLLIALAILHIFCSLKDKTKTLLLALGYGMLLHHNIKQNYFFQNSWMFRIYAWGLMFFVGGEGEWRGYICVN